MFHSVDFQLWQFSARSEKMSNRNLSYLFLGLVIFILIGVCYLASSYFHLDRWMIRFMALLLAGVIMVSGIFFVSYLSKRR